MVSLLLAVIYLAFISLGLPDSMLGSAWPSMFVDFGVPVSYAGIVSAIIALGTIFSSLFSDRVTSFLGASKTTAISSAITALSLLGFALSTEFWMICIISIPYGLGAGSVDAALNNYVSLHFSSKHMNWLHCMWGLGAAIGPFVMGNVLTRGFNWSTGYTVVSVTQLVIAFLLFLSLPIWKKPSVVAQSEEEHQPIPLKSIVKIQGVKAVMITFFCYCALEQTLGQWAGSYFYGYLNMGMDTSASLAAVYYLGITVGRLVNGFLTIRFSDRTLVRGGMVGIGLGIVVMLLPVGLYGAVAGIVLVGLGSAPIYPCIIHSTPAIFGEERSQAVIGIEMASAYVGFCVMPPLFGLLADFVGIWCLPLVLLGILFVMFFSHERVYLKRK